MANGVLMPKAGITVESCIIGEWLKNVGDQIKLGDILFTYEPTRRPLSANPPPRANCWKSSTRPVTKFPA